MVHVEIETSTQTARFNDFGLYRTGTWDHCGLWKNRDSDARRSGLDIDYAAKKKENSIALAGGAVQHRCALCYVGARPLSCRKRGYGHRANEIVRFASQSGFVAHLNTTQFYCFFCMLTIGLPI